MAAAYRVQMKLRRKNKRVDIYRCPSCNFYHLTHAKGWRLPEGNLRENE